MAIVLIHFNDQFYKKRNPQGNPQEEFTGDSFPGL